MFLVDTNVWLERLLGQAKAPAVESFLNATPSADLRITDFSLHSIGVICCRLGSPQVFWLFTQEVIINGGVGVVTLEPEDLEDVARACAKFSLDFDDAYQYTAAKEHNARLVSFDKDFDRTDLQTHMPR